MRLIQFINAINNARKKKEIEFYYNKEINNLLKLLKNEGYMNYSIKYNNNNYNKYSLIINNIQFKKLILISKPSRKINISYKNLINLNYDCILRTNIGIISKHNAIKHKVGGFIICKFLI